MPAWTRALAVTLLVLALSQAFGASAGLDRWLTDSHWRLRAARAREPFPRDILVVAIDDATVRRRGRLRYWSRARYAALLDRLRMASAVGLDILFVDPDLKDPAGDAALAAAMRAHGRVVVPAYQWTEVPPVSDESQKEVEALLDRLPRSSGGGGPALNPHLLQPPIPAVLRAARAVGFADVNSDPDGVYRAPVLVKSAGDRTLPHLSLALAAVASGTSLEEALRGAPHRLTVQSREIPLAGGAISLAPIARRGAVRAAGPGLPVPTMSFEAALAAPPETFAGLVVLVGETATGTPDIRPNALDRGLRGVELNAEILANLLHLPPVRPMPAGLHWLLVGAAAGIPLWLYSRCSPRAAAAGTALALGSLAGLMEALFWLTATVPAWSQVLLALGGATAAMGVQRLAREEAQKRHLRRSFSLYVAPELVDELVRSQSSGLEEGRRRRVAVLFSDIRGFTPYSEQNPPELVMRQMNEYLSEMTEAVTGPGGVLDKFIGDAVMALYGPFQVEGFNGAAVAVASALEMIDRLDRLNARWEAEGLPTFRVGIGIHCGEAIVGNIGTASRLQYTALGDTVNLASRLQYSTKELYGTIIVSDAVREAAAPLLGERVRFTDRGTITVRGRERPVRVFEVERRPEPREDPNHEASGCEIPSAQESCGRTP